MRVKKGDLVVVLTGDDKGKTGQVLRVLPDRNKVLVQGVNRVFRHMRPSRRHPQGGRIQKEMPIHISNVQPVDPRTNRPTRVSFKVDSGGGKQRVARKTGESLGIISKGKTTE
ncbi:MAG: 50S ribosomal protein L24 [Planctomycetes bacterium]|nr:50S ribosomal protein L24 [Planctomycetota bacterium]